jgi:hypothetical protein
MSDDSFSEVTSESWFGRLGNAIKGVLLGLILFVVSFPLLWWNEGRAVKTAKGLKEAGQVVVPVSADKVDPAQNEKLVHLTAEVTTDETLTDAEFPVSAAAVKLRRRVEMYQWKEDERTEEHKKLGGGIERKKTWTYEKTWADQRIDSDHFQHREGHANPALRFSSREVTAKVVHLGTFTLSPGLLGQFNNYQALDVDSQLVDQLPEEVKKQGKLEGGSLYLPSQADQPKVDPTKPQIGDLRISFQVVKPAQVSVLARQFGDSFEPWQSATGTQVERLAVGQLSAQNMLGQMEQENTIFTWLLRGAGFLLMAFGIGLVFSPLAVMADVLPFLGDLLRMGVGLFAAVVAAGLSLLTVAAAWLVYRPMLGIGLILLAGVLVLGLRRLGAKKRQPAAG